MFANCLKKLTQRSLTAVSYKLLSRKKVIWGKKIPLAIERNQSKRWQCYEVK